MEKANNQKDINSDEEMENENDELNNEEAQSNLEATKEELKEQTSEVGSKKKEDIDEESKNQELESVKKELMDYKERYLRLNAEFQNFRKRTEKEKSDIYKFSSEKIIIDILPIIDNLERALESSSENNDKGIKEGIEMVYKQFNDVLKKHGVDEIESIGMEFDPMLHHAVMQEESEDKEANTIIEVFQKGYKIDSKVIRPSMVKVVK